jgi:hypothetical protein
MIHKYNDLTYRCQSMLNLPQAHIDATNRSSVTNQLRELGYQTNPHYLDFLERFSGLAVPYPFKGHPLQLLAHPLPPELSTLAADPNEIGSSETEWMLIATESESPAGYYIDGGGRVLQHYVSGWPRTAILSENLRFFLEKLSVLWDAKRRFWEVNAYQCATPEITATIAHTIGLRRIDTASDSRSEWWQSDEVVVGSLSHFDRRHWLYVLSAPSAVGNMNGIQNIINMHLEPHILEARRWLSTNNLAITSKIELLSSLNLPPIETLPAYSFRVASRDAIQSYCTKEIPPVIDSAFESSLLELWHRLLESKQADGIYFCGIGLLACGHIESCFDSILDNVPPSGSVGWGGAHWPICFLHLMFPNAIAIQDFSLADIPKWKSWFDFHKGRFRWNEKLGTYATGNIC